MSASITGLEQSILTLSETPKNLSRAQARAIKKTLKSVESEISGKVAKQVGITKKSLKAYKRVHTRNKRDMVNPGGSFFMGLDPLPASALKGSPVSEDWGVKKGAYLFEGAFYRKVFGAQPKIWVRRGSRGDRKNSVYLKRSSVKKWNSSKGDGRYPVAQAAINIDQHGYQAFDQMRGSIKSLFKKRFAQEANYELLKQQKRL